MILVTLGTQDKGFERLLKQVDEEIKKKNIQVTDDTMVVEMFGNKVLIYDGDYKNINTIKKEVIN